MFSYSWDAENRLIQTESPTVKIENEYDYMSRRVAKRTSSWNSGTWVLDTDIRFLYNGWNLALEMTGADEIAGTKAYTWGIDLSGTLHGVGGIGGLLAVADLNATYYATYDANGNVSELLAAAAPPSIAAHYAYDPFGQTVSVIGPQAATNYFRFSTKYTDNEIGLLYYGHRLYLPKVGRWLSRDPIGERGGQNLYTFIRNEPVAHSDTLGLMVKTSPLPATGGCCGTQRYDPSSQCCCNSTTVKNRDPVDTGVSICKGYIKGDLLWGTVSSHTFLTCGGTGFGLYAMSHVRGGNSCKAINDDGVIKNNDLDVYPDNPNPQNGETYSICTPIKLSPCDYDIAQFAKCICAFNQPNYNPGYMIVGWNCSSFASNAVNHCKDPAKACK